MAGFTRVWEETKRSKVASVTRAHEANNPMTPKNRTRKGETPLTLPVDDRIKASASDLRLIKERDKKNKINRSRR